MVLTAVPDLIVLTGSSGICVQNPDLTAYACLKVDNPSFCLTQKYNEQLNKMLINHIHDASVK